MTPFLELRNVEVELGSFRLEVDITFSAGWTALFGPSGAGKTTLLEIVAGLRRPSAGMVTMSEREFFNASRKIEVPPRHRAIGYVPQDLALFPHLTVRKNLEYGRPQSDGGDFWDKVIERLELGALLERRPARLSGGERQRVALARALVARPALLLLDEPLTGLDAMLRERILPFLQRVRDEFRTPTLYVTHSADEVVALCDRVVVIEAGRVKAEGSVDELFVPREKPGWRLRS
jgi:molybdate transport system ATP-binding protein